MTAFNQRQLLKEWIAANAIDLHLLLAVKTLDEARLILCEITGLVVSAVDEVSKGCKQFRERLIQMKEAGTLQQAIDDYKERRKP